jgi:two-component system response regulator DevR
MGSRVKVFVLAGHRLLRDALGRTLRKRTDILVVGESPVLPDVTSLIVQSEAEVVLTDAVTSPSVNLQLLNELRRSSPGTKVLMIGMEKDEHTFLDAVRAGAAGYLLKDASAIDVLAAIRTVAAGDAVCPPRLCMTLFKAVAQGDGLVPRVNLKVKRRLTRREQELVPLIAQGLTNREIASRLNLSEQTIKNYVHRMLQKIGVEDRLKVIEAVRA